MMAVSGIIINCIDHDGCIYVTVDDYLVQHNSKERVAEMIEEAVAEFLMSLNDINTEGGEND